MEFPEGYCCVCVEKRLELRNVQSAEEGDSTLLEKLQEFCPKSEWQPDFCLCEACVGKLNAAFAFLRECALSETIRKEVAKQVREEEEAEAVERTFGCDECGKTFKLRRFLKTHVTRVHGKVKAEPKPEEADAAEPEEKDEEGEGEEENVSPYDTEFVAADGFSSGGEGKVPPKAGEQKKKKKRPGGGGGKRGPKKRDPLNCEYCGKLFNRRQHWSAHIRANHTFERPYECERCDAAFVNSHSLLVHRRKHDNERPYVCTECGKTFVCSGDLYHHAKIHSNRREYRCELCDKRFNTSSILRTHKIVKHTAPADWRYECVECGRRFPIRSSLRAHVVRHTGVRAHGCHVCEKHFFSRSELQKHVASHGGERLHRCPDCGEREYKSREGLRRHLRAAHGVGATAAAAAAELRRHVCHLCPKSFSGAGKLRRHLCSHTGERPYACALCPRRFLDAYSRRVHAHRDHPGQQHPEEVREQDPLQPRIPPTAPPPPPPPSEPPSSAAF